MQPRLFITGPSGCGKSTMIRRELGDLVHRAGGFQTCRDRDESGRVRGFEILSADGYGPRDRFLDLTGEQPRIDLEVFSGVGLDYLRRAQERPFAVMDEIGGVELLNDRFMNELARYLGGSQPCIGVKKGQDDLLAQINDILAEVDDDTRQEMFDAAVDRQPK